MPNSSTASASATGSASAAASRATGWYYALDGERQGPFTAGQLKAAAAGSFGADDMVWHASLPEWVQARRIPGLSFGAAPAGANVAAATSSAAAPSAAEYGNARHAQEQQVAHPAELQAAEQSAGHAGYPTLAYAAPAQGGVVATPKALDMLRQTRPWAILIAVLMLIGGAFLLVGSVMVVVVASTSRYNTGLGYPVAIMYVVMAGLYIIPALFLIKYGVKIKAVLTTGLSGDLEDALEAQKNYWRILGIAAVTLVGLFVVAFVLTLAGAARIF